jgi:transposase
MSEMFSKMEVITGVACRRRFTTKQKRLDVNETLQPGMSIRYVARRHGRGPFQSDRAYGRQASKARPQTALAMPGSLPMSGALADRAMDTVGSPRSSSASGDPPVTMLSTTNESTG